MNVLNDNFKAWGGGIGTIVAMAIIWLLADVAQLEVPENVQNGILAVVTFIVVWLSPANTTPKAQNPNAVTYRK